MFLRYLRILSIILALGIAADAGACTSMLVSPKASATGRPLMWKHRDTGAPDNFLQRVDGRGIGYVALFDGGDSLLTQAWMGMNDRGFAIMNTASYNLAPDTAAYKDAEGLVMSRALATCVSVEDFQQLLLDMPKPMGVQANFGVMDADGGMAYFETDDYSFRRYDVADSPTGVLIRTNFSFSGNDTDGMGYIRYDNACHLAAAEIAEGRVGPWTLTEGLSRSFWHSKLGRDCSGDVTVVDQDFIPRRISTASIVVEGINPGQDPDDMVMWAVLGYPPAANVNLVRLQSIPEGLTPLAPGFHSPDNMIVRNIMTKIFPVRRGSGKHYIDMNFLRPVNECKRAENIATYKKFYGSAIDF